jgi:hypothetical protein
VETDAASLPAENLDSGFRRRVPPWRGGPEQPKSFGTSHDVIENKRFKNRLWGHPRMLLKLKDLTMYEAGTSHDVVEE